MDDLLKHLGNIWAMDRPTLTVISALCLASLCVIRQYLPQPAMVIFAFPVLLFSSVLVQYFFMLSEIYIPSKLDQWLMWTVLASMCGNMIGIALLAAIGRFKDRPVPVRVPAHRAGAPRIPR